MDLKEQGNLAVSQGRNDEAISCYTQAIYMDPNNHVLYSNRSAVYAKIGRNKQALEDANTAVGLSPTWMKGHARKAAAHAALGELQAASDAYAEALRLEPTSGQLKQELEKVDLFFCLLLLCFLSVEDVSNLGEQFLVC
eukprot:c6874_g1_i1.p1 GENE.c6874_g1_i1~~c6874_g1_i1.p1  ORF type:complete len:149 (-),score=26.48 c6874_g1_i1:67-483(-)